MVKENKGKIFAAVAGVVVGAGAAIAGAVALADKKNQEKAKKLVKVVKTAQKGVKNI